MGDEMEWPRHGASRDGARNQKDRPESLRGVPPGGQVVKSWFYTTYLAPNGQAMDIQGPRYAINREQFQDLRQHLETVEGLFRPIREVQGSACIG